MSSELRRELRSTVLPWNEMSWVVTDEPLITKELTLPLLLTKDGYRFVHDLEVKQISAEFIWGDSSKESPMSVEDRNPTIHLVGYPDMPVSVHVVRGRLNLSRARTRRSTPGSPAYRREAKLVASLPIGNPQGSYPGRREPLKSRVRRTRSDPPDRLSSSVTLLSRFPGETCPESARSQLEPNTARATTMKPTRASFCRACATAPVIPVAEVYPIRYFPH